MSKKGDNMVDKIIDVFRVVVAGAIVIYAIYLIIFKTLLPDLPWWVQGVLIAIGVGVIYMLRDEILKFTKKTF